MSISKPILYGNWRSSSSQRVRIGLGLKSIEFEYRPIDLSRGEQTSEKFRQLHPGAQVPVLVIDGLTLSQSVPILEFLDERFPDQVRLLPDTMELRFAAREIAAFVASFVQPFQLPGVTRRRMIEVFNLEHHELGAEGACRQFAKEHLAASLAELDRLVARQAGTFCIADAPTLADCVVFPQLVGSAAFGVDVRAWDALSRIYGNCMQVAAFTNSMPEKQIDARNAPLPPAAPPRSSQ